MVRAGQRPGRRRAVPEPRSRRSTVPRRSQQRPEKQVEPDPAPRDPLRRLTSPRLLSTVWLVLAALATLVLAAGWTPLPVPGWAPTCAAVAITALYAYGLAARTGGRPWISGGLSLALSVGAVVSALPVLVAGAAVGTAVLAAVLGVMSTKPAGGFPAVVRECFIALSVAVVGALAVEAYRAQVSLERIGYLALGLSLLAAIGLVYRLGAGLQGLGRRGFLMLVSGLGLLIVILAYTEALSRWGSPGLTRSIDEVVGTVRSTIGGVPRPMAVLLGFPALAWGISTRARRRQGWWVCAFGAAGLAVVTVSLLNPRVSLVEAGLSVLYSAVLGLLLGYLVIRVDKFLTGTRGSRARQYERASAHRPEPGRMRPLL